MKYEADLRAKAPLPVETLTGLGQMCLLDAGVPRLPSAAADPGVYLHEEFAMEMSLYHPEKEG